MVEPSGMVTATRAANGGRPSKLCFKRTSMTGQYHRTRLYPILPVVIGILLTRAQIGRSVDGCPGRSPNSQTGQLKLKRCRGQVSRVSSRSAVHSPGIFPLTPMLLYMLFTGPLGCIPPHPRYLERKLKLSFTTLSNLCLLILELE